MSPITSSLSFHFFQHQIFYCQHFFVRSRFFLVCMERTIQCYIVQKPCYFISQRLKIFKIVPLSCADAFSSRFSINFCNSKRVNCFENLKWNKNLWFFNQQLGIAYVPFLMRICQLAVEDESRAWMGVRRAGKNQFQHIISLIRNIYAALDILFNLCKVSFAHSVGAGRHHHKYVCMV